MSLVIEGRKSRVGRSPRIDYLARIGIDHEGRCRGPSAARGMPPRRTRTKGWAHHEVRSSKSTRQSPQFPPPPPWRRYSQTAPLSSYPPGQDCTQAPAATFQPLGQTCALAEMVVRAKPIPAAMIQNRRMCPSYAMVIKSNIIQPRPPARTMLRNVHAVGNLCSRAISVPSDMAISPDDEGEFAAA